jgi:hypothetical protein
MSLIASIINGLIIPTLNMNFSPIQNNCLFAANFFTVSTNLSAIQLIQLVKRLFLNIILQIKSP